MDKMIYMDMDLCVGCGACAIACMDQNDIETDIGQPVFRRIYRIEDGHGLDAAIRYTSAACMHCGDSPCIIGCPTGAISKDPPTGAVMVKKELCIGCHSCSLACPFGVPRYDREEKMAKCGLCSERVENGFDPACVRVCPFSALKFGPINQLQEKKEADILRNITRARYRMAP